MTSEVLSRPEYAWRHRDDAAWLDLFEDLREWFDAFQTWMDALAVTAPALFWAVFLGLVGLLLVLIAHIAVSIRAALRAPEPEDGAPRRRAQRDRVAEAAALADEGRYLDAARQIHLVCLEILIGHEVLHLGRGDAGRAVREALATAPIDDSDRITFEQLLDRLERAVFRDGSNQREMYDLWKQLHGRLSARWGRA